MGFDPNTQLALQTIQNLNQTIQRGREKGQEQLFLEQLMPQLQQAQQDPGQLFQTLLQGSLDPQTPAGSRQSIQQILPQVGSLAQEKSRREQQARQDRQRQMQELAKLELKREQGEASLAEKREERKLREQLGLAKIGQREDELGIKREGLALTRRGQDVREGIEKEKANIRLAELQQKRQLGEASLAERREENRIRENLGLAKLSQKEEEAGFRREAEETRLAQGQQKLDLEEEAERARQRDRLAELQLKRKQGEATQEQKREELNLRRELGLGKQEQRQEEIDLKQQEIENRRQKNEAELQLKQRNVTEQSESFDSMADTIAKVNTGELSLEEAEEQVSRVGNLEAARAGLNILKSRRTEQRLRDRLDSTDPEVKLNVRTINEIKKGARTSKQVLQSLERQENLVKTGKTSEPSQALASQFPIISRFLKNPESQELQTEALESLKGAVGLFQGEGSGGTRFTDAKLRLVLDRLVPGRGTKDQQLAAIRGFKNVVKGMNAANEALNKVREENPDTPLKFLPDLEFRIEENMDKILNDIDKDFEEAIQPATGSDESAREQRRQQLLQQLAPQ